MYGLRLQYSKVIFSDTISPGQREQNGPDYSLRSLNVPSARVTSSRSNVAVKKNGPTEVEPFFLVDDTRLEFHQFNSLELFL